MKVQELLEKLPLELVAGSKGIQKEIQGGYCGDLLSIVMAYAKEQDVWLTVQGHENAVAVALMAGISAIILTQGVKPNEAMCDKANQYDIPVLTTSLSSYDLCIEIHKLLD